MPNHEIDYSNTIIYKITCKDSMVSDLYVGHTTNFVQRKHAHKQSCINEKSLNYKCKLYEVIRNNGGWINWTMEIINFFNCKNHYEARKKEQEYFLSLNATLNSIEPYAIPKPREVIEKNKEFLHCKECNKYFNNTNLLETHNKTNKHMKKMNTMITENNEKRTIKYCCEKCDFKCCKQSDWVRHISTEKHKYLTNIIEKTPKTQKTPEYDCVICNRQFNSCSGLWKHKKKCNADENSKLLEETSIKKDEKIIITEGQHIEKLTNVIMELVKSNTELQKQISEMQQQLLEVCKNR